jgi:hypothetical protein
VRQFRVLSNCCIGFSVVSRSRLHPSASSLHRFFGGLPRSKIDQPSRRIKNGGAWRWEAASSLQPDA